MATYQSSVGAQLAAYERNLQRFVRATLLQGGRKFRSRMMRERLSGPPGLNKKKGRLRRSLRYRVFSGGSSIALRAQIGGPIAPYAELHEEKGRLAFQRVFREEAEQTVDALRTGIQFLAGSSSGVTAAAGAFETGAEELGLELGSALGRFDPGTRRGQRNLAPGRRLRAKVLSKIGV